MMKIINKKHLIATIGIISLIILLTVTSVVILSKNDKTVFTLNGYKVLKDEFMLFLNNNKALTVNYFKEKYNADYDKDFWNKKYNGESPLDYAKQKTIDELVKIKLEQILMKENGIIDDFSYDTFVDKLNKENNQRQKKIKDKQPIYGPTRYGAFEYYSYYQSTNHQNLIDKLAKDPKYLMPDKFYEEYYDSIKESYFKNKEIMQFEKITVEDGPGAKDILEGVKNKVLAEKIDLYEVIKTSKTPIKVEKQVLESDKVSKDDIMTSHLQEELTKLKAGDFSNIFKIDDKQTILRLTEIKDEGYKDYKDVKNAVVQIWIQNQLDEKLNNYLKNARVEVNHVIYDEIKLN